MSSSKTTNNTSEASIDDETAVELKLPFTLSEKIFLAVTSLIAIYEIAFWLIFDYPVTLHSKQKTPLLILAASAALNAVPHVMCGTYGLLYMTRSYKSAALLLVTKYKHNKELKANTSPQLQTDKEQLLEKHKKEIKQLPVYQKGGLRFCIYVLYVSFFTLMQAYFWWLPYFFGVVSKIRFQKMQTKMKSIISILPPNENYLVPSAEHTILFPLSIIAWLLSIQLFMKYRAVIITQVRTRWPNYVTLAFIAAFICYLPTSMAFMKVKTNTDATDDSQKKQNSENTQTKRDLGAAIVAVCLMFIVLAFFSALFWSPHYAKAKRKHSKKQD